MTLLRRIFWAVGWGMAGLVVGAFLLGYAAPYLPPASFWWTDLFAVVLPPLGLAVGGLGLGLLAHGLYRRRWGRVAIAGVLLALVVVRFGPGVVGGGAVEGEPDTMRVMTFNLPPSRGNTPATAAALRQLMQRETPDILALQESWIETGPSSGAEPRMRSGSTRILLDASTEYRLPQACPPHVTVYQPVLGRFRIDSLSIHPLPPAGETDPRSRYTRVYFDWQDRPAVLYNVHLHTVGVRPWDFVEEWPSVEGWRSMLRTYREGARRRAEQARRLRRQVEQASRPVLVVGDFNSTPHQWAYRHIAQGLQRAGRSATFPAHRPLVQIDHILAGPAWEVVGAHVPVPEQRGSVSDHRPVVGRLRWRRD